MSFPTHPEKHRGEAVATPEQWNEYRRRHSEGEPFDPPAAVVVCYSRGLMRDVTERYDGREVGHYYGDLYLLAETDERVGVLGNFGIGAPTTAMLMDELAADGVGTFLGVGVAGALTETVEMGDVVVCERAVRDEGTSHHYLAPESDARASESLVDEAVALLATRDVPFHVGPSWTTDAIYRETVAEVEHYADDGVLTVEMEAAAMFAVAQYRDVEAGSLFVVSDYLDPGDWNPQFHRTTDDLRRLLDVSVDLLEGRLS